MYRIKKIVILKVYNRITIYDRKQDKITTSISEACRCFSLYRNTFSMSSTMRRHRNLKR